MSTGPTGTGGEGGVPKNGALSPTRCTHSDGTASARRQMGYLGPPGTFSELAAREYLAGLGEDVGSVDEGTELVACASIEAAFEAVSNRTLPCALVPSENVVQGPVTQTLDLTYSHAANVRVAGATLIPIVQCVGVAPEILGGAGDVDHADDGVAAGAADEGAEGSPPRIPDLSAVRWVRSHPQALRQVSRFLAEHVPGAELREERSTAAAVAAVAAADPGTEARLTAAVATASALEAAGLTVVARDVGNVRNNQTRFVLIVHADSALGRAPPRTGRDATQVVVHPPRDRRGMLHALLRTVSEEYELNMSAIHSRPDLVGGFRFHFEVEGHVSDPPVSGCIASLRKIMGTDGIGVHVVGSHPRCPFGKRRIRTIGIVGGAGRMGRWFDAFFRGAGLDTVIHDVGGPDAGFATLDELVARSDAVLVSVPIDVVERVVRDLGPRMRRGQLLLDNTSVKTQPVRWMLESTAPGVEVLGMHTVFGNSVPSPAGRNVIFCHVPERSRLGLSDELEALFYKHGARVTRASPERHDRQMAMHQNLVHVASLALADVLHRCLGGGDDADAYTSPNSRSALATAGRVVRTDPGLLAQIQRCNVYGPEMVSEYAASVARLRDLALAAADPSRETSGDPAFSACVTDLRSGLGEEYIQRQFEVSRSLESAGTDAAARHNRN